jgi:drug/metabolite transporter (DMT)-like permease
VAAAVLAEEAEASSAEVAALAEAARLAAGKRGAMNNDKQAVRGAVIISIAAILWGLDGVVLTPRLFQLNVGFVVFMLHMVPFALMQFFLFREYRRLPALDADDWLNFALIAIFGGALGTLSIVHALFLVHFEHLSIVVLLQKLQPIFAIIMARLILGEQMKRRFFLWAGIAVVASYVLTFGFHAPHIDSSTNYLQASLWAILAAFSFGSSTVFSKRALRKFSFYTTNFFRFGITSLLMLIYVLITGALDQFAVMTPQHWGLFVLIGVTTGSGAIFLYYYGLKHVSAMVSTICELLFPLSAVVFDYLINGQRLTVVQWLSAAIMLAAVINISYKTPER